MTRLPPDVLAVLRRCTWVHKLNMGLGCEGCANDGEPGYCKGAGIGPEQDFDPGIWCHCGHEIVMVELPRECACSGPEGWHCPGEDSEHWSDTDGACGYCGGEPYGPWPETP